MTAEIAMDLIKLLQISLRKNGNLSSYNPDDTSLPNLPSVEESIAALDPSPPYIRCKHCNGRFLRGTQSFICGFCGKEACKDSPSDPINFRNTLGFRWLLESLDLDGSETVGPPVDSNNSSRRQTAPKNEILLSDLLDLKIKWISKSEKVGTSLSNETLVQGTSSLNLAGVTIENFFFFFFFFLKERNSTCSSSEESSLPLKQTKSKESTQSPVNLKLFENVRPLQNAVLSTPGDTGYSDSGQATNFRHATATSLQNESTSRAAGFKVDLFAHMDEVFGPIND